MARATNTSGTRESGRGPSATQLLRKDHETVKQLFERFEKSGDGERGQETKQGIFSDIERELETHATVEEEIFYPAMQDEAPGAKELVQEAIEEHSVVKSLLREIGSMSAEDEQYDAKVKVLKDTVEHHVGEEEGQMFPKAEQLPSGRLQELGSEIAARKQALGQPALKRIMSGVSGLLFGNGETKAREQPRRKSSRRTGASAVQQGRGTQGSAARQARGARQKRRSAAKTATKSGASKRSTGGSGAHKRSTASAKKRGSGRRVEARGATKRATRASAGGRGRAGARKTVKKR